MLLVHTLAHPGAEGLLPTLVALHGYGAHGQDLLGLHPMILDGQLLMICPQAPYSIDPGFYGFSWCHDSPGTARSVAEIGESSEAVGRLLDEATARYPVDPRRVVLLGFSQGGTVAALLAMRQPERFVGLALLSSSTDERYTGELAAAPGVERLPVLVQHGQGDVTIPVHQGPATVERLRALGMQVEYEEYAMGHEVSTASARGLSTWLGRVLQASPD